MNKLVKLGTSAVAVAVSSTGLAQASGFVLEQKNARALGAAFAGATARQADSGYASYNPAALGKLGSVEISLNATGIWSKTSYANAAGFDNFALFPISGSSAGADFDGDALIPNLSIAVPLGAGFVAGLVVDAPYGLKTDFDPGSIMRYHAQYSEAKTVALSGLLAWAPSEFFTIGAGLRIQKLDLSVTGIVDAGTIAAAFLIPGFLPGSSDLFYAVETDDVGIGFSAGMQATLSDRARFGAAYQSKITHDVAGDATFDLSSSLAGQTLNGLSGIFVPSTVNAEFTTPAIASLGFEFDLSDKTTLLASTTYTFWSSFDQVAISFANPAQPPEVLVQNWNDAWSFSVGIEHDVTQITALRAGFMFDQTPVNDAFASPRIPDSDRYWATIGATHAFTDRIEGDLGVAVAFFENRTISLSGLHPSELFRGSLAAGLETTAYAVSGRLRYAF